MPTERSKYAVILVVVIRSKTHQRAPAKTSAAITPIAMVALVPRREVRSAVSGSLRGQFTPMSVTSHGAHRRTFARNLRQTGREQIHDHRVEPASGTEHIGVEAVERRREFQRLGNVLLVLVQQIDAGLEVGQR